MNDSDAEPSTTSGEPQRHPSLDDSFDPAIRIDDYDPAWPVRAEQELARIGDALGGAAVRLQHVGSTSVPGLPAKPIVDLQVCVADVTRQDRFVTQLEQLGYLYAADPDSPDFHFFGKPPERPRSYHVHVCEAGSDHEFRHIAMRDYLRSHPEEAAAYGAHKREVAERYPQNRTAYIAGKEDFVVALEARAVAWGEGRDLGLDDH